MAAGHRLWDRNSATLALMFSPNATMADAKTLSSLAMVARRSDEP